MGYLLVATACRGKGVGRTLIHDFVEYCRENQIENCYLWPDGETAEKINQEAGFLTVEIKQAGWVQHARRKDNYGKQILMPHGRL